MRHNLVGINDRNRDLIAYSNFSCFNSDTMSNKAEINRMKNILSKAMVSELTTRQRDCLRMYYYDNMKMKDIAVTLGLSNSTVSRHIKAAQTKLKNVARYY